MENQALEVPEGAAITEYKMPQSPAESIHEKVISQLSDAPLSSVEEDQNIIDFVEDDPENPFNWPTWRKWVIVILVCTTRMLV